MSNLILTRKKGQSLVIDGNVTVHVLGVQAGRVRLSIDAPPSVPIHRTEAVRPPRKPQGEAAVEDLGSSVVARNGRREKVEAAE